MTFINKLIRDEAGATAIEYGLIAALIAVAAIGTMTTLGGTLRDTFDNVATQMQPGTGGGGAGGGNDGGNS
jgi:pilus assembly protein Flp/PilA